MSVGQVLLVGQSPARETLLPEILWPLSGQLTSSYLAYWTPCCGNSAGAQGRDGKGAVISAGLFMEEPPILLRRSML